MCLGATNISRCKKKMQRYTAVVTIGVTFCPHSQPPSPSPFY